MLVRLATSSVCGAVAIRDDQPILDNGRNLPDSRTVKQKVGTLLEAELVKEVRRVAAEEGKRMSDVFAEALVGYLAERRPDQQRAMRAYRVFCESPMPIDPADLQIILDDDMLAP